MTIFLRCEACDIDWTFQYIKMQMQGHICPECKGPIGLDKFYPCPACGREFDDE